MNHAMPAYGLWGLVLVNSAVFVFFALSFFRPRTKTDWRTFGTFSAFVVALFVEMYGFPLTIYLLSGWLQRWLPGTDLLAHDSGHFWHTLLNLKGDPHTNPIHIASNLLLIGGFFLLASAWKVLYAAQTEGRLATTGPYARVRHPQYAAFLMIMFGFLVMWPTLLTVLMFPILAAMYVRLALREERDSDVLFGEEWRAYAARTPRFLPTWGGKKSTPGPAPVGTDSGSRVESSR